MAPLLSLYSDSRLEEKWFDLMEYIDCSLGTSALASGLLSPEVATLGFCDACLEFQFSGWSVLISLALC